MARFLMSTGHGLECQRLHSTRDALRVAGAANVIGLEASADTFDQIWCLLHGTRTANLQDACDFSDAGDTEMDVVEKSALVMKGMIRDPPLFHIMRNADIDVSIGFRNIAESAGEFLLRAVLVRTHKDYCHFAVNEVCKYHCVQTSHPNHVLQPSPLCNLQSRLVNPGAEGTRGCVTFLADPPNAEKEINMDISLRILCTAGCSVTNHIDFVPTEYAQELAILLTLEVQDFKRPDTKTLARQTLHVWPKNSVSVIDLMSASRFLSAKRSTFLLPEIERIAGESVIKAKYANISKADLLQQIQVLW